MNSKSNNSGRRKNASRRSGRNDSLRVIPNPPQFNATIRCSHKFRFKATSAFTDLVIATSDLMSLIVDGLTTTTSASIFSAFKVKRVSLWGPPASDLVPVTVSLEYANPLSNSGFGARRLLYTDTSVGSTEVAFVTGVPLTGTSAAAWQNVVLTTTTTNGASFTLSGPINTIIDVDMDLVLQNGESAFTGPVGTALVAGRLYGNSLDGGIAGLLQPVGLVLLV